MSLKLFVLFSSFIWSLHAVGGACELVHARSKIFRYPFLAKTLQQAFAVADAVGNSQIKNAWAQKVSLVSLQRHRWVHRNTIQQRYQDLRRAGKSVDFNLFFKASMNELAQAKGPSLTHWRSSSVQKWIDGIPVELRSSFISEVLERPENTNLNPELSKYHDLFVYFLANEMPQVYNMYGFMATLPQSTLDQFLVSYAANPNLRWHSAPSRLDVGGFVQLMGNNVPAALDYLVRLVRYQARNLGPVVPKVPHRFSVFEMFLGPQLATGERANLQAIADTPTLASWISANQDRIFMREIRLAKALIGEVDRVPLVNKDGLATLIPSTSFPEWSPTMVREFDKVLLRSLYGLMAFDTLRSGVSRGDYKVKDFANFSAYNEIMFDITVLTRWAFFRPLWIRTHLTFQESIRLSWLATSSAAFNEKLLEDYRELFPTSESLDNPYVTETSLYLAKSLRAEAAEFPESTEFDRFFSNLDVGSQKNTPERF